MKRLSIFRKRTIQRALLEILLIFIGVNLSVGFTNWNQARKERQIEIDVLKELYNDMEEDIHDIESNRPWLQLRQKSYFLVQEALDKDLPMDDTLKKYIRRITGTSYMNRNQAAYENYKSRGLETIENDSLRMQIMRYYGERLPWLFKNEGYWDSFSDQYLQVLLMKHFDFRSFTPYDFNSLKKDQSIRPIVFTGNYHTGKMIQIQDKLQQYCLQLKKDIELELVQLTGEAWPPQSVNSKK